MPFALTDDSRVVAVLRARHASAYAPVIESLIAGGVTLIELTLTTAGVVEHLPGLRRAFGQDAKIGVGTVVDPGERERSCSTLGRSSWSPPR